VQKRSPSLFTGPALMGLAGLLITCAWIYVLFAIIPAVAQALFG
jgi:hypothetical protein